MVTRGAQHVLTRPAPTHAEQNPLSHPAAVAHSSALTNLSDPGPPAASVCVTPEMPSTHQTADRPSPSASDAQGEFTLDGIEFSPQPIGMSATSPFTLPAQAPRLDYSCQETETAFREQDRAADESTALPDLQAEATPDIKVNRSTTCEYDSSAELWSLRPRDGDGRQIKIP
ncbi:hypothetical protein M9458_025920 [Cirrhinus mrigala]|uniref:Uncharacterized protein n=1 Tax=Cirrhinus mrigala TaxID=683832 RepID=A0ABD0PTD6_CIRMR